jgi:M-phase inducer tyrosine phosphatase
MSSSDQITISQQLYEEESDNIGQQDGESALDKLCVPSPIMEKTLVLDDDTDEQDDSDFNKREIGSPIQKRPIRSKVRRIHSMFYSKKEITDTTNMFGNLMNSKSPNLDKIHNTDDDHEDGLSNSILRKSKIETFNVKNDSIPRISVSTLCKILDGCYQEFFDEVTVVDCRFEYEYKGGHIYNAVNVSSQRELEDKFLNTNLKKNNAFQSKKNKLIVFHCEFSSYRGPLMASHLRTCDRNINQDNYPHLDYPDILILEGGYKTFFDSQSHRCYPQKYVEMNDNNHKSLCERELNRFKRDLKKASSFNNLSFAASVNSASTINTKTTSTKIDRRTVTSGAINFTRRPSLKSQFLDMTRSTNDIGNISESDDENKPPESLNFAFKFPKRVETPSNQLDRNPSSAASKLFTLQPKEHNDTPIFRKKLSRSLTYNM